MENFKLWYLKNAVGKHAEVGLSEPLYAIGGHKDTLDLSTGVLTRRVKKITLDGSESINGSGNALGGAKCYTYTYTAIGMSDIIDSEQLMTEIEYPVYISDAFRMRSSDNLQSFSALHDGEMGANSIGSGTRNRYIIFGSSAQTANEFKALLAANPVTIWYVLAQPETETVTVPQGLSGIAEGYLRQSGTPTPSVRIYPEGNGENGNVEYSFIPEKLRKYFDYKYKVIRNE